MSRFLSRYILILGQIYLDIRAYMSIYICFFKNQYFIPNFFNKIFLLRVSKILRGTRATRALLIYHSPIV